MSAITAKMMAMIAIFDQPDQVAPMVEDFYAESAVFRDPVQTVRGRDDIKKMFRSFTRLFKTVETDVIDVIEDDSRCVIHWEMTFVYRRWPAAATIKGVTWLELNEQGQCVSHTDYWDLWKFFRGSMPFGALKRLPGRIKSLFA
ncbi:MAG: nuclear transport factor 2 family protein [Ketobacteraceae bacterium]|nr:nuclear transport factor 2 family protein [Ketobacteraceae bacterium]